MCSGVWFLIPSGNLSGQSVVQCGPYYHQEPVKANCSGMWSLISLEYLSGQSAVPCGLYSVRVPSNVMFTAFPEGLTKVDLLARPIIYYKKNKNKLIS
jgi:hypothetical protein